MSMPWPWSSADTVFFVSEVLDHQTSTSTYAVFELTRTTACELQMIGWQINGAKGNNTKTNRLYKLFNNILFGDNQKAEAKSITAPTGEYKPFDIIEKNKVTITSNTAQYTAKSPAKKVRV